MYNLALPIHWHSIKATVHFMRTGSLQVDAAVLHDMVQVVIYFITYLNSKLETENMNFEAAFELNVFIK